MRTFFEEKQAKLMKAIRLILASLMLIGNPALWLGVASTSVRWVLPAFVAATIFAVKTAYAKKFHTAQNQVTDYRKIELSADPTDGDLGKLRVFEVPLRPSSAAPIAGENHDLAAAIKQTFADQSDDSFQNLQDFVTQYPQSRWVLAVELNRGLMLYKHGYFTKVVEAYQTAWNAGKTETQNPAMELADRALAELMQMDCRVGRLDEVKRLMGELKNAKPDSVAAFEINRTKQAIWHMENKPGSSFLCGPFALQEILKYQKSLSVNDSLFQTIQSPNTGFSLNKLLEVSDQLGMNMQMAKRKPGAAVIVPAVVNWKLGHYAALVEQKGNSIHSIDPTFRNETWLSVKALDSESSGYFLVPAGALPQGWEPVSAEEGSKVFGKGFLGIQQTPPPCDYIAGCCPCSSCGMPTASIDRVTAALMLKDTPLFYKPPVGPAINFSLQYHQNYGNEMPASNFGTNWAFSWQGNITYDVFVSGGCSVSGGMTVCSFSYTAYNFQCFEPGGGGEVFTPGQNSVFTNGLYQVTETNGENLPTVITCRMPDGSVNTYSAALMGGVSANLLLTEVTDPQGNSVNLTYDSMDRISSITDAIGQSTTISYTDTDPYKITQITDHFGQTALFHYDSNENLQSITDLMGLTTTFAYNAVGAISPDWPASMTTPYGTTYFNYTNSESINNTSLDEIEIVDPLGLKEHARFGVIRAGEGVPIADSYGQPAGALTVNELTLNYWDKKAMEDAPMSADSALSYNEGVSTDLSESYFPAATKKALESSTWYAYPGQINSGIGIGGAGYDGNITCAKPATISRNVLGANGSITTQTSNYIYNPYGQTTQSVDPKGRQLNYVYNNLDVITTTDGAGDILNSATYNSQHEPLTTTDAAGKTTHYSYNAAGQITTMTTPMGETTSYHYDSNGYLTSVVPPQPGSTVTYTYDSFGRVYTKTDAVSGTITYTYDSGNRMIEASYPDSTHETYLYNKLDLQSFTDRQGRTTSYTYDADRRKISTTDPKGQATQYTWCACGSMTGMTDPKGNKTTWDYDLEGRVITKTYNDGSSYEYQYSPTENLLTLVTDAKHQQTQYVYDVDDKLLNVNYLGAQVATPNVAYQYDLLLGRLVQMKDGTGTTSYTYYPFGGTGGNQIQEISQPVGSSSANITYSYDNDGRVIGRSIDGVSENYGFSNAELTSVTNPLGNFTYTYDSSSARLSSVAYPNGQNTSYSYFSPTDPNGASGSLKTLTNLGGGSTSGQTLSKFCYTYKPTGEITTWQQQLDNIPTDAKTYTMGYDNDSELTSATLTTGTSGFDNLTANQAVTYGYDASGNRTTEYAPSFVHAFNTNNLNQLTTETDKPISITGSTSSPASILVNGTSIVEDASNNYKTSIQPAAGASTPLTIQATTSNGTTSTKNNHILNTVPLVYDANGSLSSDNTKTYTWDAANRLVGVSIIGPVPTTQANNIQMSYDGIGRRNGITELHGTTVLSANTFIWVNQELCQERDLTGHNVSTRFYSQGEQINGISYYYTIDHLGSIREMVDSSGNVQANYDYDSWGRQTQLSGSLSSDFGYTGFYVNRTTGFGLTLNRIYDSNRGGWLTRDPLGETVGRQMRLEGTNLYRYVLNNTFENTDPLGLAYFAKRKLDALFGLIPVVGSLYHEQLFFEDGQAPSNAGYFADGSVGPDTPGHSYQREDGGYCDCIMRDAYKSANFNTGACSYNLLTHNCQSWADAVRARYAVLAGDAAEQKKCCKKCK